MAESCTHDCSTCGSNCPSRTQPQDLKAPANAASHIKHVIGVVSGKGGVGKAWAGRWAFWMPTSPAPPFQGHLD